MQPPLASQKSFLPQHWDFSDIFLFLPLTAINTGFQHLAFTKKVVFSQTKPKQLHNTRLINLYMQQKIKRLGIDFSNMTYTLSFLKYYITMVTVKCCSGEIIRQGPRWHSERTKIPALSQSPFLRRSLRSPPAARRESHRKATKEIPSVTDC